MASNINDRISTPGEVVVNELTLVNHAGVKVDLLNLYVGVEIYENIFSNVLTGKILVEDRFNMRRNIPLIGKEKIRISFKTPSTNDITKEFQVYEFLPVRVPGKELEILSLNFSTIQNELDYSNRISKSFSNQTWSEMVQIIFNDYLRSDKNEKLFVVEDTHPRTTMVIPSWTPLQAINWISGKAEYYGNCDYLFYESLESFHFVPLAHLKTKKTTASYKYTPEIMLNTVNQSVEESLKTIKTFINISDIDKKSEVETEGILRSSMLLHDPTFKTIEYNEHVYINDHQDPNIIKLETHPIAPLTYVERINPYCKYIKKVRSSFTYDNVQEQYSPFNQQKRISHVLRNNSTTLKFDVSGDSRRKLGDVVELRIPSPEFGEAKKEEDVVDGFLSGRYIISAIGHHIERNGGYEMAIEVMKDSLREAIPDTVTLDGVR